MAEVVCRCGVKRENGYLYFVNKKGDLARAPMARAGIIFVLTGFSLI